MPNSQNGGGQSDDALTIIKEQMTTLSTSLASLHTCLDQMQAQNTSRSCPTASRTTPATSSTPSGASVDEPNELDPTDELLESFEPEILRHMKDLEDQSRVAFNLIKSDSSQMYLNNAMTWDLAVKAKRFRKKLWFKTKVSDNSKTEDFQRFNAFPEDLRENILQINNYTDYVSNVTVWVNDNPACNASLSIDKECAESNVAADIKNITYREPALPLPLGCNSDTCDSSLNQEVMYDLLKDKQLCFCSSPISVGYRLKSPGFSYFPHFKDDMARYLSTGLIVMQYQINISDVAFEGSRLKMVLKLFPVFPLHKFNDSEVARLYDVFSTWVVPDSPVFGPAELLFVVIPFPYVEIFSDGKTGSVSNKALAVIIVGAVTFTAAIMAASKRDPRLEQIKESGVRDFEFEEMALATKNFDKSMEVGRGGYGRVYRGLLRDGKVVAIKRAQVGSLQGAEGRNAEPSGGGLFTSLSILLNGNGADESAKTIGGTT
ncbi:hypothetical protein L7F22_017414 [Adiantum nelumboides]|nr:hypothetical protein [Adiantum nelumboides]